LKALGRSLALAALIASHCAGALGQALPQEGMKEVQVAAAAFTRGAPAPDWTETAPLPDAARARPVVVRLADTQFRVAATPGLFVRRAIQCNDASTLKKIGEFPIYFAPDYQRLTLHWIHVLRGAETLDRTQSANVRFLQPASEFASSVYTSVITAAVVIDDVRVGDTLEYAFTIDGDNPVFGGRYFQSAAWDGEDPTDLRRVILTAPESRRIAWRSIGDAGAAVPQPSVSVRDGARTWRFEERALEPVALEASIPPGYSPLRWIQFSEFASWSEVNAWAATLFPRAAPGSGEFAALVEKLRVQPSAEARLSAALAFTQREIRYFSLSFGESSHRPASPDTVLQRRFGDCKDKSYLLTSLLDALGVEAHPVLLSLQRKMRQDQLLPSPGSFDHVIVEAKIGERAWFVDPTMFEQKGRIDRLGQAHERAQVLVVGEGTTGLTTIPASDSELATIERRDEAVLKRFDGEGELVSTQIVVGQVAGWMRALLARIDRKAIEKEVESNFDKTYPGAALTAPIEVQDDTELNRVVLTYRLRIPDFAHKAGNGWLVPYRPENLIGIVNPQSSNRRTLPMKVQLYPYTAHYSFVLLAPPEVAAMRDPDTQRLEDPFFEYAVTQSFRGNRAQVDIEFHARAAEVPPGKVAEYSTDVRRLNDLSRWYVVVTTDDLKKKGFLGIGEKSLRDTLLERTRDSIDKYTATIKSEKLGGSDLARAYCERSIARHVLGEFDQALEDANRAVELAPNEAEILACRSAAYFASGDFAHAAADTSRAVLLGEGDPRYFLQRGQARYYLKQFADAADDFAKAGSRNPNSSLQAYSDLWAVWSCHQAGKPLPDEILKRAAENPRGDWPRPALAMLTGGLSSEEMLKIVNRKGGDELAMTQTEAYFYLGQHYRMLGDRAGAREAFERVRSLGVVPYIEYIAAGFELKDLGDDSR
jgi:lipoprotein NlpI/transglutaminase-like putative cysteine protease